MRNIIQGKGKRALRAVCILLPFFIIVLAIILSAFRQPESPILLSNPDADATAQSVYAYILSLQGNRVLSAQQESTWMGSEEYETEYIFDCSGKYPAMRGLDYMNDDFSGVNRRAVEWWKKGGLVTICWHTGADFSGAWEDAMNDEVADWDALFTEGTAENKAYFPEWTKPQQHFVSFRRQALR